MRGETLIFRQNDEPLKLYDLTTDFRNSSYIFLLPGLHSEKIETILLLAMGSLLF